MHIEEVITEAIIDLDLGARDKYAALEALTDLLFIDGRITDKAAFIREVVKREDTETTDLGFGVAIPHGMTDLVKKPSVAIGKLKTPVRWDESSGEENEPIYVIFLMATSPDARGRAHIEIISKVATLLIEDDFIAFLKDINNKTLLVEEIKKYLGDK